MQFPAGHVTVFQSCSRRYLLKLDKSLILPGVGHFGHCLSQFAAGGYSRAIRNHVESGKPFLGICVGLQALFEGSAENPDVPGFGIIPGYLRRFDDLEKCVPHIGWNTAAPAQKGDTPTSKSFCGLCRSNKYYYVHSYAVPYECGQLEKDGWSVATAQYGSETFVGAVGRGKVFATQFHPEKSGSAGLRVLKAFLDGHYWDYTGKELNRARGTGLTRRIIACLDVRTNDQGDLVVTKGDQYDVRETNATSTGGQVRNLGKPVDMAKRYYEQGSDEIVFLNITSFRNCPLVDLPMLEILRRTSETVFVPLTVGGGIRDTVDTDGAVVPALSVARMYFDSGAYKISIGSDAVVAAEEYYAKGEKTTGATAIETISAAYGNQAVVVSVDPKRVYVSSPGKTHHHTIPTECPGPNGERYCWYQCTIRGGRESRDIDVRQLVKAVEVLGAGEILLNCIDRDGSNRGFDLELINDVKAFTKIPVISSSGAGNPGHFFEVFSKTSTDAALGAGMVRLRRHGTRGQADFTQFHRCEFTVKDVKDHLRERGVLVRGLDEVVEAV